MFKVYKAVSQDQMSENILYARVLKKETKNLSIL